MLFFKLQDDDDVWGEKLDLLVAALIMAVLTILMVRYSFFDWWYDVTRAHESWELDESMSFVAAGLVAGSILSLRQNARLVRMFRKLKKTEEQLRIHEKEKILREKLAALGQLSSGLAHEINNSLQPILGLSELIKINAIQSGTTITECAGMIYDNALYMREIVRKIMIVARDGSEEIGVYKATEFLPKAMSFTVGLMPTTMTYQVVWADGINQVLDQDDIHISRTDVVQVITNLLTNARYAMQERGEIVITISTMTFSHQAAAASDILPGKYIRVAVEDKGCGMDAGTVAHVFEPFFTTKPEGEGTGLGLSMSYGLVRKWGGTMDVSSAPGEGTTICFYIPIIANTIQG
jgi:signal transduction histidine kinase